jgi:prophage regulatory protein
MTTENIASTASADPDVLDFIDVHTVTALTGLSVSGIYRLIGTGNFPAPVRLSPKVSRWFRHEILEWRNERIAERGQGVRQ